MTTYFPCATSKLKGQNTRDDWSGRLADATKSPVVVYTKKLVAAAGLLFYWFFCSLERFSVECRKTKTKVITLTNHNSGKQSNKPIRTRSKYMKPAPSAGKRVQASHDWFWFYF